MSSKSQLSHFNAAGEASMVDVTGKNATSRTAAAYAFVAMQPAVLAALPENPKGDPFEVARVAGILGAKKTADLIPLCHQLPLSHVSLDFVVEANGVAITARASTVAQTGVEMEAMTAAAVAALTIYDMTKALDKGIEIRTIRLLSKSGGKSGEYVRPSEAGRESGSK